MEQTRSVCCEKAQCATCRVEGRRRSGGHAFGLQRLCVGETVWEGVGRPAWEGRRDEGTHGDNCNSIKQNRIKKVVSGRGKLCKRRSEPSWGP